MVFGTVLTIFLKINKSTQLACGQSMLLGTAIVCLLIAISCSTNSVKNSDTLQYSNFYNPQDANLIVPFVVYNQHVHKYIFRDPMAGIKIVNVLADNNVIAGKTCDILFDDGYFSSILLPEHDFIYMLESNEYVSSEQSWTILVAKEFTMEDHILEYYEIPKGAKQIEIKYQIRFLPDLSMGPITIINLSSSENMR